MSKIKDPKKVAAGKARAAKAIRVDGKFTTNKFLEKVKEDAATVGAADPYQFYLQNQNEYKVVYETKMLTTNRQFQTIKNDIKNYNGRTYKNNKEVRPATIIKSLNQLNQYLKTEHNVVAFWQKMELSLNGKMNINLPSIADIEERLEYGESIEDILEDEGISCVVSADK